MPSSRLVDIAHLSRYTGGDAGVTAEVLRLFIKQTAELLDRLDASLARGDAKTWREVTHSLKGAARAIGAFQLADAAAKAEEAGTDKAARALKEMRARAYAVAQFVEAYLAR